MSRPSVVIVLDEADNLILETWHNGARRVVPLLEDMALRTIWHELLTQKRELATRVAEAAADRELAAAERHRRVYARTAEAHGTAFARKLFGSSPTKGPGRVTIELSTLEE